MLLVCSQNCKAGQSSELEIEEGCTKSFELVDSGKEAVNTLKRNLTSTLVLALPRAMGQFMIDTDACDYQMDCMLLKRQDEDSLRLI